MGISLPMNFRTAEYVRVPSFSFTSLRFSSFWSGQLIVPPSLSPSVLTVRVAVRFCPPISYSHFHIPTGSTLSAAPARPQTQSTNAIERIAFMIASEKWGKGSGLTQGANSPRQRINGCRDRCSGHSDLDSLCHQGTAVDEPRGH